MKKKRTKLQILHDKAWKIFSRYIRLRDNGKCFTCGVVGDIKIMQAGHFIHKQCLDFNEININCQCVFCNKWKHGNLGIYATRLTEKYNPEILIQLERLGNEVKKFTIKELEEIIKRYSNRVKVLEIAH